jgi:hypothetical protein
MLAELLEQLACFGARSEHTTTDFLSAARTRSSSNRLHGP